MKKLRFLFVLLLICCLPISAFAMDEGYINGSTKWQFNDNVVNVPEQHIGSYSGIYNYYTDIENNCFYLNISYTENSLKNYGEGENDIYLNFDIKNSSNQYSFRIDEYSEGKISDALNVSVDFGDIGFSGQDIYVGIEFLNKEDKKLNNYLTFSLVVNGYTYHLCDDDIELAYGGNEENMTLNKPTSDGTTIDKPSTTQKSASNQTTTKNETTTKFKYTYTATTTKPTEKESNITTEEATKPKTETTTKFKPSGTSTSSPSDKYSESLTENGNSTEENTTAPTDQYEALKNENGIIIPETNTVKERSPYTMLLTALAVICAAAGIALIVRNVLPKKKSTAESNEEE